MSMIMVKGNVYGNFRPKTLPTLNTRTCNLELKCTIGHFSTSAEVGTTAEVSWVWILLSPKCQCQCQNELKVGFKQLLCATSFDTVDLEIAINYSVFSQSVNASFTWDLTIQSVRFWIVFLTEHKIFDILSVLVDTHRTRSATARLPINRTRSSDFL